MRSLIAIEWKRRSRNGREKERGGRETLGGGWRLGARCQATALVTSSQPLASSPYKDYQSNFMPKRASRGAMIVTGSRNVEPEPHVMFEAGFAFVRL
jgi:hypothetical protein